MKLFHFQGNQSRLFLKKLDLLEIHLRGQPSEIVENGIPYIDTFRALDKVVELCFGGELKEGHEAAIEEFKKVYLNLEISISPKVSS